MLECVEIAVANSILGIVVWALKCFPYLPQYTLLGHFNQLD